ncbi:DUF4190 domain-containing protein [Solwaraspora sp. WMMB335]|uniref:DUF4190 domain-containing protein n=1 Tax=Solwaraspora sp. WMMB335 TaxID=3404118 RepID=UPI003B9647FC
MSQPYQPGNWNDPSWPSQQPFGSPDPAGSISGQPSSPGGYPAGVGSPPAEIPGLPPGYPAASHPGGGYPATGYPPPGYPTGYPYPVAPPVPMNGRAIAALVLGVIGILGLCAYLAPGTIGIVGALLGHSAKRQIRAAAAQGRPEQGDGLALAGIITGWIAFGIGLVGSIAIGIAIAVSISQGS